MISKPPSELEYNEYQRRKRVCGNLKKTEDPQKVRGDEGHIHCVILSETLYEYMKLTNIFRGSFGGFILFNVLCYHWEIIFFIIWYNPLHVYLNFLGMKKIIFLSHRAIGIIGRSSLSLMHIFLFFLAASFPTFRVSEFLSSRALLIFL